MINGSNSNINDEVNPFEDDSEIVFDKKDLINDNNNKQDLGYKCINFFEEPKEIKQNIEEIKNIYNQINPLFGLLIEKYNQNIEIYKKYSRFKDKVIKLKDISNNIIELQKNLNLIKNS